MSTGSILLLPGSEVGFQSSLVRAITNLGGSAFVIETPSASTSPMSVLICAQVHEIDPVGPLVVVAPTSSVDYLPAIALAQRAAHRHIGSYYLIDPLTDPTGPTWPDAPVYITRLFGGAAARLSGLRGWREFTFAGARELADLLVAAANL